MLLYSCYEHFHANDPRKPRFVATYEFLFDTIPDTYLMLHHITMETSKYIWTMYNHCTMSNTAGSWEYTDEISKWTYKKFMLHKSSINTCVYIYMLS